MISADLREVILRALEEADEAAADQRPLSPLEVLSIIERHVALMDGGEAE
jgi:hypothetical protein